MCLGAQSCLTVCDPMDCILPGYSVHGIFQARVLEWAAISFTRGSSDPGFKPSSSALQADSLLSELPEKPQWVKNLPAMQETMDTQLDPWSGKTL